MLIDAGMRRWMLVDVDKCRNVQVDVGRILNKVRPYTQVDLGFRDLKCIRYNDRLTKLQKCPKIHVLVNVSRSEDNLLMV